MIDQTGNTAWITGASSGIGEALALTFLANGGRAILSGRNKPALEAVAAKAGAADRCLILPFDTTEFDKLSGYTTQAAEWSGGIDVLVNNAGISQRSLALETDFSVYRQLIEVDLLAPIALTQAVLPHMAAKGGGAIVNISSVAGKVGSPLRTGYSAAKHGLIGYGDSLRSEVAGLGIKVLNVAPGSIKTNVSRNALMADGSRRGKSDDAIENGIDPIECAAQIWNALSAGAREIIIAKGMEASLPELRAKDPEKLFDLMESLVQQGYASKMNE